MTARKNQVRLALEQLEDRCTPGGSGGSLLAPLPAPHSGMHAATADLRVSREHAIPIKGTTNCFVDINSMTVTSNGFGTGGLGHWTALGHVDSFAINADQAVYHGTFTVFTANGDLLFLKFTTSWQVSSGQGTHEVTVTGGTGRFAGASGGGLADCTITFDPASQTGTCHSQGYGTLILAHP